MNLLVTGMPKYKDYIGFCRHVDAAIRGVDIKDITIYAKPDKGVCNFAEKYAKERNIKFELKSPDWEKDGKRAGYANDIWLVKKCTKAVIIWDGKDKDISTVVELLNSTNVSYRNVKVVFNECKKENNSSSK